MREMLVEQRDVFYYVTVMNENYVHPAMPADAREGIVKGMYRLRESSIDGGGKRDKKAAALRVQLLGSGTILREVLAAAEMLEQEWKVSADVWSVTSFTELRREGMEIDRWNRLHPDQDARPTWVEKCLGGTSGPVIAATDYMRSVGDMIRNWVPRRYTVLGTDGFGRSDTRVALRRFFEVDRHHVVVAALKSLADEGSIERKLVKQAIERYGIDSEAGNPWAR
ncbi:MAG: pyruvate dehydrogenase (acetyl-transferring), homodimeric type, partial [Burkholderiales bacterium]|nr:pyruvate dehydrogenase (acetyl-transferring), homodimeric type [Burkholderiales bacterium]